MNSDTGSTAKSVRQAWTWIFGCLALFVSSMSVSAQTQPWWKSAVIYEVYPRSFADSNGDGTGDLNGVTAHLDYLQNLGVDAIWFTPFYPSPLVDFGYDISDYFDIDPRYGTLADFDRMVAEAKKRNIRVILDLVVNHTSDQHPWFIESKSSKTNAKADWYVWHDAKPDGQPPTNWLSSFGGSAWQRMPERNQFYYHRYYTEQPDLNWRNPQVREAVFDILRFWLKRGVAGFRLDGIGNLYEDAALRDEPVLAGFNALGDPNLSFIHTRNQPETHEAYRMLRKVSDEFPDTVLVGQVGVNTTQALAETYGNNDKLHLPINAQFGAAQRLTAAEFRQKVIDSQTALNGNPPLLVLDSHDRERSWTRYSDGVHDVAIAKLLATLMLAPRGAALIYYGQEIGMENNNPKRIEDVQDPVGRRGWPANKGRDGERTPMQWTSGLNAGFSTAKTTWLPIAPSYVDRNVASQTSSSDSILNYYKALIQLRKTNSGLRDGTFESVNEAGDDIIAWVAKSGTQSVLVALNLSSAPRTIKVDASAHGLRTTQATTLISSSLKAGTTVGINQLTLPAYGSFIGSLQQ